MWPEYIDIKDWAANLIVDYPDEYLPILEDADKWEDWASIVAGTGVFARNDIPAPFSVTEGEKKQEFKDWQEWAKTVYNLMINSGDKNV
ncbi:MAG: hypothetical protein GY777_04675 [Candidatus Brocadiaceae bacterium]|nr:hypothetical protein [Candidatus Brocadiaceae bacterium]